MQFVQEATPGKEEQGYSEVLLGVDGECRGIEITAWPEETAVIEGEGVMEVVEDNWESGKRPTAIAVRRPT